MSEKIFALLLRLYPRRFRQHYETEAILLLRDRFRDEQGTARRLRLIFDLLADCVAGLPLAWRNNHPSPAPQPVSGDPSFRILDQEPLRPGSVMMAGLIAASTLGAFIFVMSQAPAHHYFSRFHGLAYRSAGQANPSVQDVAEELDQRVRTATAAQSCGFDKLELHPGNIGYVKLNSFASPDRCGQIAQAVMERLNSTDAIIFDLRDNRGGFPQMVGLMADYLFDRPVPWYNPRSSSQEQSFTHSPVPGSRLANKPVFILTSPRTFSAAEHFTYDLKTLKRATIIGETTSGGSHGSGPPPEGTIPVWEGTGVLPDVRVNANDALRTAETLAQRAIKK